MMEKELNKYTSTEVFYILSNMLYSIFRKEDEYKDNFSILVSGFNIDTAFEADWYNFTKEINPKDKNNITVKEGYKIACKFMEFYAKLIKMDPKDTSLKEIYMVMKKDIDKNNYNSDCWHAWIKCWEKRLTTYWYYKYDESKYDEIYKGNYEKVNQ